MKVSTNRTVETLMGFNRKDILWNGGSWVSNDWRPAVPQLLKAPYGNGVTPLSHPVYYRERVDVLFDGTIVASLFLPWDRR